MTAKRPRQKSAAELARESAVSGVQTVSGAGRSVTKHSLGDLLKLAEFENAQDAASDPNFGIRLEKNVPLGVRF